MKADWSVCTRLVSHQTNASKSTTFHVESQLWSSRLCDPHVTCSDDLLHIKCCNSEWFCANGCILIYAPKISAGVGKGLCSEAAKRPFSSRCECWLAKVWYQASRQVAGLPQTVSALYAWNRPRLNLVPENFLAQLLCPFHFGKLPNTADVSFSSCVCSFYHVRKCFAEKG